METLTAPVIKSRENLDYLWLSNQVDLNSLSQARCVVCLTHLTWAQWLKTRDDVSGLVYACCRGTRQQGREAHLKPEDIVVPKGLLKRTWYHASRFENWAPKAVKSFNGDYVAHAGSLETALNRADDEYKNNRTQMYLHSFKLKNLTKMQSCFVLKDEAYWADNIRTLRGRSMYRLLGKREPGMYTLASRELYQYQREAHSGFIYVNEYETPGALSVMFQASQHLNVETVQTTKLTRF